ncbi:MAG: hypothetical protein AAF125_20050, partial [Chloroflexota bacterium]
MSIRIEDHESTSSIVLTFTGRVKDDEIESALSTLMSTLDDGPICVVADLTQVIVNFQQLMRLSTRDALSSTLDHSNLQALAFIIPNPAVHALTSFLADMIQGSDAKERVIFCSNRDE